MITIPKKMEYSVELVSYLSRKKDKTISLSEIAKNSGLPYRFLGQLTTLLKRGEILESKEGKSGGYTLAVGWRDKTLLDLVKILKINRGLVRCLGENGTCVRADKCKMRRMWSKLENQFLKNLDKIKLDEI